jgi:hypothetical protein
VETKLISDFGGVHGVLELLALGFAILGKYGTYGQILFVGEHKEKGISQFVFVEHALQLLAGLDYTITIVAVNDEDDALRILEVMSPQRPDLVLTTNVPDGELDVLVLDGLDIKPC